MASDYSPPRLVKPTPGGSAGDGSMDGALTVRANAALGNSQTFLRAGSSGTELLGTNSLGELVLIDQTGTVLFRANSGAGIVFQQQFILAGFRFDPNNNYATQYNNIALAGLGLSPIYGANSRVTVAATTSPGTTLTSFTPGATGSCKVNVTIKNKDTVAVTAYVLVAYTDPDVGAQSVLIINGVSIAASGVASAHFVLDSTATAITVSAYGSVANELVCTADIEQFA